ncbi:MAG: helix-turn-helix transcriptional regulator [Lachnospiraceae bacterium]|nr:helix-turn-helix transcriptional regulator [Lachnospiraceae bacterium]
MMNVRDTNIGKIVRVLRENRGITRLSLAEAVGISESYLKKIEAGVRQPGVHLYQKMLEELEAVLVIVDIDRTVKGSYIAKAQEMLMESSEAQAEFMIKMMEYMLQNMGSMK